MAIQNKHKIKYKINYKNYKINYINCHPQITKSYKKSNPSHKPNRTPTSS